MTSPSAAPRVAHPRLTMPLLLALALAGPVSARQVVVIRPRTPALCCAVQDPAHNELGRPWITGVSSEIPLEVELATFKGAAPDVPRESEMLP